jgi:hypothetical protein
LPTIGGTDVPAAYASYVNAAAASTGLPAAVVAAQINEESGFNPSATSPTGAQGIAQFEPGTFASYGSGSAYNVADAFAAYTSYMSALLKQFGGNVADALAAYNAGPGNLPAGAGYASTILGNAGAPASSTATPAAGTGSSSAAAGTGSSAATPATLLAATGNPVSDVGSIISGVIKDFPGGNMLGEALQGLGRINHIAAVMIDRAFSLFMPGQGFRAVFWAATALLGIASWKTYQSGESPDGGGNPHLPMALLLTGAAIMTGFLAFRPWPVSTAGRPLKPGAYLWEITQGTPPPAGPPTYTPAEVTETEAGLDILLGFWAIHQLAGTIYDMAESVAAVKSAILGWWGNLF